MKKLFLLTGIFAVFSLVACSGGMGLGGSSGDALKDAQKAVDELKQEYMLTLGTWDKTLALFTEWKELPKPEEMVDLKKKEIKDQLTKCVDAPSVAVKDAKKDALDFTDALSKFKDKKAYKELKAVNTHYGNLLKSAKHCQDGVEKKIDSLFNPDMAEAKGIWTKKMDQLSDLKLLLKNAMPKQLEKLTKKAAAAVPAIATAKGKLEAEKKLPTSDKKKIDAKLKKLAALETEAKDISKMAQDDAGNIGKSLSQVTETMVKKVQAIGGAK